MRGPLRSDEVLAGLSTEMVLELERGHGNGELIRVLEYGGIEGPFRATSPWELSDSAGVTRINASGYAASPFGERYPPLVEFVRRYLDESTAMGLPQQSASAFRAALEANLVTMVSSVAPSHADSQVFFANSGSEAIEGAVKFCLAWRPEARTFINFERAFHGKTLGALSLTPNEEAQELFRPLALETVTLPFGDLETFERTVQERGPDRFAGIVLEPIQGEAGVIVPPREFLAGVDRVAKEHGIPVVADEIQSGLGRSGYWLPSIEWGGMDPDVITLAKPLSGGMVPVGAIVARREMFRRMLGGLGAKRHSNTFGGNSLAMAVGLKSLEILRDEGLVGRSAELGARGLERLQAIAEEHPSLIADVRGFGMWYAIEFRPVLPTVETFELDELVEQFTGMLGLMALHRAGVHANLSLNAGTSIRLTPPLTIPEPLFEEMFDRVAEAARRLHRSGAMLWKTPPRSLVELTRFAVGL